MAFPIMLTFDLDAESGALAADAANANRPGVLSIGQYGPRVGVHRILRLLDQGEDAARAEGNDRIAGFLRRAASEIQPLHGRRQAPALDRKRTAMARLAEALWGDLVEELPRDGLETGRPRRKVGPWY